jgi:2'-5' RNA ligase
MLCAFSAQANRATSNMSDAKRFTMKVSPSSFSVPIRLQCSLFVPRDVAADLEAIRRILDPVQSRLIPAHVTLCREDELGALSLDDLQARLRHAPGPITLRFGPPEAFGEHGLLLPAIGGIDDFQSLRELVLADRGARPHVPHLTLAHPRNPKSAGNSRDATAPLRAGLTIAFDVIQFIEQVDNAPWTVRGTIPHLAHSSGATERSLR